MTQKELGKELARVRELQGLSLEQLAQRTGVSKSYLSKIENGHRPVPKDLLEKFAEIYKGSAQYSALIGGHRLNIQHKEGERRTHEMNPKIQPSTPMQIPQPLQVSLDAKETPVLYSDWNQIATNDGGIIISFGQSAQPSPMVNVVSRIGLSHTQAKELYKALEQNLQNYFKSKNMEL